jgi:hypothetical protein
MLSRIGKFFARLFRGYKTRDLVIEELLEKSREALERKQREWAQRPSL